MNEINDILKKFGKEFDISVRYDSFHNALIFRVEKGAHKVIRVLPLKDLSYKSIIRTLEEAVREHKNFGEGVSNK